jgi:hypothetical protein
MYLEVMGTTAILDRLLDPVGKSLTLKAAKAIANLRADETAQARIDQLGDKCRDGTLTDEENSEYELYVQTNSVIAILQAKARGVINRLDPKK